MSEENTSEIVDEVVQEQTGNEQETEQQPETPDRDYEKEARDMGWVDKADFKGDADRWTDAQKFVERGETLIPFLRADKRKLEEKLEQSTVDFTKRLQRMEAAQSRREAAQAKQFESQLANVKAAQQKAFKDGDEEEFNRLDRERDALQEEQAVNQTPQEDIQAIQQDWTAQNPWYNTNFEMAQTADQYSQFLARQTPGMAMSDNLKAVDAHVREKFPAQFGMEESKPKPPPKQTVDGGSNIQASPFRNKSKGYASLPQEAKEMCQRDIADGLFTDKDKDKWAKEYYNGQTKKRSIKGRRNQGESSS